MKILIAEDDNVSRRVLSATLTKLGHHVHAVADGAEAWAAYQDETVPLLISDWMMPALDGLELTRMIRAEDRTPYTYIILLTALGGKGSYLQGMKAGADDFITKPFDPEVLQARLHVAERVLSLQAEVKKLEGLLPMCSYCHQIRDEKEPQDTWVDLEEYVARRTEASFSHGVCPTCYKERLKPELEAWKLQQA